MTDTETLEVASTVVESFTNWPDHVLTVVRYRRPTEHGIVGEYWTCGCGDWSEWLELAPPIRREKHRPAQAAVRGRWNNHRRGVA